MTGDDRITITLWRPRSLVGWLDWCLGRGRYPRADRAQIIADAEHLLNSMSGGEAYHAASQLARALPPIIDPARSAAHWQYVRAAIADHLDISVGLRGYDR